MTETDKSLRARLLFVKRADAYGKKQFSPDCVTSRVFTDLLGQKHLTAENIENIKRLGYRVKLRGGDL